MRPFDALTEIDKKTIQYYLEIYGESHSAPLPQVLEVWNKNKTTLFKAFGKQLRIEKSITIPKDVTSMNRQLSAIYSEYVIRNGYTDYIKRDDQFLLKQTRNNFIADVLKYWVNQNYSAVEIYILSRLFCPTNVSLGYIDTISEPGDFTFTSFKATIKNGMKTIRTIQKLLKLTHYPNMDLFNEWRNAINCLSIGNEIKAKLVLSIHPIDFMSMSDNDCNWSSCMSWGKNGCYRAGTLEMMNSNLAVVAYLEGPQNFKLDISEDESYIIPNKSWRSLFFVHKDILLNGKSYPYHNDELTFKVLNELKNLVKKNLNWDYQFGIQEYKDMNKLDGNFYVRDFFDVNYDNKKNHHCIFVYTNGMYNDLIEYHDAGYFCYRNYVSHSKKLCLSGPATCICCGRIISTREEIFGYDDLGTTLFCNDCNYHHRCRTCDTVHYHIKYHTKYGNFCSDECCHGWTYLPKFDKIAEVDALHSHSITDITIIAKPTVPLEELEYIIDDFENFTDELFNFVYRTQHGYNDLEVYTFNSTEYNLAGSYRMKANKVAYRRLGYTILHIYRREPDNESREKVICDLKQKISDLKVRIPLLEHLKGG